MIVFIVMVINVEIARSGTENSSGLLRRFSRRIQESGMIREIKKRRYKERNLSRYKVKKRTLEILERKKAVARLIKLGKLKPLPRR